MRAHHSGAGSRQGLDQRLRSQVARSRAGATGRRAGSGEISTVSRPSAIEAAINEVGAAPGGRWWPAARPLAAVRRAASQSTPAPAQIIASR